MEPVLIILIVMSFTLAIVKMGIDHSRDKAQLRAGKRQEGETLRLGELRDMIRETVRESNAELEERIGALENKVRRIDAPPASRLLQEENRPDRPDSGS